MVYYVFDIETDGLIDTVSKIHCVCIRKYENGRFLNYWTLTDVAEIKEFFEHDFIYIGHNVIRYDLPVLKKLIPGLAFRGWLIDSLGLSWYLYPNRSSHNLEDWGTEVGIEKPAITDWSNLTVEEYINRCERDVQINERVFWLQYGYLLRLYDGDASRIARLIRYLMFKLDCAREQEEVKWRVDIDKCSKGIQFFIEEIDKRLKILTTLMPKVIIYKLQERPKRYINKDGSISKLGQQWLELLKQRGLPDYHLGTLKIEVRQEDGNPGSHQQLKKWLFDLGWQPQTFDYKKEKDGVTVRAVPQITSKDGGICDSIKELYDEHPELKELEGLFVMRHRLGLLNGFMEKKDSNNMIIAAVMGFTNTLRFKHTTVVNLPTIVKAHGEIVRGCLIAPDDNHVLCGSDLSGIEESTKHHYMYYYDPNYVTELRTPGFDAHLDLCLEANLITKDDIDFYKSYDSKNTTEELKKRYLNIKDIRMNKGKKANFGAIYGAGIPKIALTARISLPEAKVLHVAYWKRNWAVKKIAEACIVKEVNGQKWLLNPISQFWYSLRFEKDRFSTLNQGTAVYVFDTWVRKSRNKSIRMCGQFHDEIVAPVLIGKEQVCEKLLREAIEEVNEELSLNVQIGISVDFGHSYADIH